VSFDPRSSDLGKLFRDRGMFDTADDWHDAGFKILRESENKICVASHSSANGYLFKKYVNAGKREDPDDQLKNYKTRVDGARRVRALISDRGLRNAVAPSKWIRELPSRFGSHILIVERLDLLDDDESKRAYHRIDEGTLRDLCTVLYAFRGLDSTPKNVPITRDGKVAFIDTEHWDRHSGSKKQRPFLKYIREYLESDMRDRADRFFAELGG
jgi:hypothetical protein